MHALANPARFLRIARPATGWLLAIGLALTGAGMIGGLALSSPDYLQGETVRIMYVHVPAAWLGMAGWAGLAAAAVSQLVWRHALAAVAGRAIAPCGATFTAICLATGSIWGRPTWGTWWEWDPRLTSELVLLFIYFGVMGLHAAIEDRRAAARAAGFLALIGMVNVPIVHFAVNWWNTLHQGATISLTAAPKMAAVMLVGMLTMTLAAWAYCIAVALARVRAIIIEREQGSAWLAAVDGVRG